MQRLEGRAHGRRRPPPRLVELSLMVRVVGIGLSGARRGLGRAGVAHDQNIATALQRLHQRGPGQGLGARRAAGDQCGQEGKMPNPSRPIRIPEGHGALSCLDN